MILVGWISSRTTAFSLLSIALVAACGRTGSGDAGGVAGIEPGTYRAELQLPGGKLPFGLDLERGQSGWSGHLIDGPERLPLNEVTDRRSQRPGARDPYYVVDPHWANRGNFNMQVWLREAERQVG